MADIDKKTADEFRQLADEQFENGNYAAAIEYYEKCVEKEPSALVYDRIGYVYAKIDKYKTLDEQIKYHQKALELNPNFASTIRNLAFAYSRLGKHEESVESFRKLLDLKPIPDDFCSYGCLKIQLGDFEEGWELYKYRFLKHFGATFYPQINKPEWNGETIENKTLLVYYEQGFGDSIQFFRYLEQVKPLVKKIIFVVQKELVELLKNSSSGIEIIDDSISLDKLDFDYHIPIMNLPHVLKARIDNIPLAQGHIKADTDKIKDYKEKFFDNECLKIGISYSGAQIGNERRNVPLEMFYPLTKIKNAKVYSFQKGYGTKQLEKLPNDVEIVDLGKTFNDFSDTAAAMANVDLFVTSDNSVFNLAASMGKKTFVLLSKDAEWRWFLDEETTPWYDSVKIFKKQTETENWDIQMQRVVEKIKEIK